MKVISTENLSYSYDGEHPALTDVSFSVEEGSYVAVIGHNGSGKSTLAKVLMGLLSGYKGTVTIFGIPLSGKTLYSIRSRLGIVFQNPDNQFVGSTVADDIAFGLENRQVKHEEMDEIVKRYASQAGMADFLEREPQSLSGGQKQRVAIAGVLAMNPDVVLFDEATAMLDPKGKHEISDLIVSMKQKNPKLTILSITHDVEEAAHSDQVIVLNEGKLFLSGTPEEVFAHDEELSKIQLDIPFVFALKKELAKRGVAVPKDVRDLSALEAFLWR
ncbi:MAG: Energy-coupling factor transporter ATP-binding protein EcfA1 [Tenericutes bacterium ADurb.BinA155]|jgi:energy-coupling factor transport system ATP-binding protein|nr:MAG: Energy-coupling factor transporter ATP-binding protein EcfA1 [Tenericutes bacterium ADurb.BinA155]